MPTRRCAVAPSPPPRHLARPVRASVRIHGRPRQAPPPQHAAAHVMQAQARIREISRRVFDVVRGNPAEMEMLMAMSGKGGGVQRYELPDAATSPRQFQFELYKRQTTVLIPRDLFLHLVCQALVLYKYLAPNQRNHLTLACRAGEPTFSGISYHSFIMSP